MDWRLCFAVLNLTASIDCPMEAIHHPENLNDGRSTQALIFLVMCGVVSAAFYTVIREYSSLFDSVGIPVDDLTRHQQSRPILLMLVLFTSTFVVHSMALKASLRCPEKSAIGVIFAFGILFRVILVSSIPIQEIDLYRYMWDGAVTAHGVSPYQFAPATIRDAEPVVAEESASETPYDKLIQLRDSHESWRQILGRIHYSEIATVYPPVSQAVFAASYYTTPKSACRMIRIMVLKVWMIAFDLLTFTLVIKLCGIVKIPRQYALLYGWCPLVLKEFANSAHLDAIPVCFAVVSVLFVTRAMKSCGKEGHKTLLEFVAAAVFLSLAIGAKLFPIILAPLFAVVCIRKLGLLKTVLPVVVCLVVSALCLWPMFSNRFHSQQGIQNTSYKVESQPPITLPDGEIVVVSDMDSASESEGDQPESGLKAFLSRWRMNDFLFGIILENLKPESIPKSSPWYVFTPESWRRALTEPLAERLDLSNQQTAFLMSRITTVGIFILLTTLFCWRVWSECQAETFLRNVFLAMAWFWLLLPTQNPWYWTWALPFLPFAHRKAWGFVSSLLFLYYLRFWLLYHYGQSNLLGTGYNGPRFFDNIVVWIEFAPWFLLLMLWRQPLKTFRTEEESHSVSKGTSLPSSS